jgi:hypothetical protein
LKRGKIVQHGSQFEDLMKIISKTLDHEFRGVVDGTSELLRQINSKYFRGISSLKLMDEYIAHLPCSFMMTRKHALIEPYNEIIGRLRDAGITEYWLNYESNRRKYEKIEEFGPEVLDMGHLEVRSRIICFPLVNKNNFLLYDVSGLLLRLHVSVDFCFYRFLLRTQR